MVTVGDAEGVGGGNVGSGGGDGGTTVGATMGRRMVADGWSDSGGG